MVLFRPLQRQQAITYPNHPWEASASRKIQHYRHQINRWITVMGFEQQSSLDSKMFYCRWKVCVGVILLVVLYCITNIFCGKLLRSNYNGRHQSNININHSVYIKFGCYLGTRSLLYMQHTQKKLKLNHQLCKGQKFNSIGKKIKLTITSFYSLHCY